MKSRKQIETEIKRLEWERRHTVFKEMEIFIRGKIKALEWMLS
jgi:ActR/RegA family two-component response regulator